MSFIPFQPDQDIIADGATETIGVMNGMGSTADSVVGYFITDHAGNLTIEQSVDGTNWDFVTTIAVTANVAVKVNEVIIAPHLRIRFDNDAGAATTFTRGAFRTSSAGYR